MLGSRAGVWIMSEKPPSGKRAFLSFVARLNSWWLDLALRAAIVSFGVISKLIFNMSADVRLGYWFYRACESRGIFAEQVPVPMVTSFVVLPAPHSLPREPVKQSTLCQGSRGLLHL